MINFVKYSLQQYLAEDLGYDASNLKGPQAATIKAAIQNDYARLDIFYQTLNVKAIEQSPKISVRFYFYIL